ncbi:MAG: glycosyltransferase [Thermoleophilia bacterium]|nr:glycosyltransferase [Thermoleophilia bacterium]
MPLRVCMVTPFAWSRPHPVNEHVAAAADELRRRGHAVVVIAPSNRAADLAAGRRSLRQLARDGTPLPELVAIGPALRVTPRSRVGVPLGVRANLALALAGDRFDVVHAHEPGIPSLGYLALRHARGLTVATFHAEERLAYPPGRRQREKLLTRVDALTATSNAVLAAARERFPGDYVRLPVGVDVPEERDPGRAVIVAEWRADAPARARASMRVLAELPGWELVLLRTRPLAGRPYVPRGVRDRVRVHSALDSPTRARALAGAAAFVPAGRGSPRPRAEAAAAGVPVVEPPGADAQPALVAAELARLAEDPDWREVRARQARAAGERESVRALGDVLEQAVYRNVVERRRRLQTGDPLADRPYILCDLHVHTEHSHDCSVPVPDLLDHVQAQGLGAVAITDHNVYSGAFEAAELARGRRLTVIPGEEVKTTQGEVIGLFLSEAIPAGMTMVETIGAVRDQGGVVYLPHPFDRLHSIPDARTLHSLLAEIDVFEVYNAKLLLDGFNDEALRFARKYNLVAGAGSDAHVLQAIGTGGVRMRQFHDPEEFLVSLRSAEVLRRPKSLVYLQGLKWMAQARDRRSRALATR